MLDSGPLGMISNPKSTPANSVAKSWLNKILLQGDIVALPEIADYEVRRSLLLHHKTDGLAKLDALEHTLEFLPFTRKSTRLAAQLWADARRKGMPTAELAALDGDVILAAQAICAPDIFNLGVNSEVVVATSNPRHLSRYVKAVEWSEIS